MSKAAMTHEGCLPCDPVLVVEAVSLRALREPRMGHTPQTLGHVDQLAALTAWRRGALMFPTHTKGRLPGNTYRYSSLADNARIAKDGRAKDS